VADPTTTGPNLAAQIDAMDTLGFMLGRWRGTGWTIRDGERVEFDQDEHVRRVGSGDILTVEGSAHEPDRPDRPRFAAFAIVSYDPDTHSYSWRAYSAGHCLEVPLHVGDHTFTWDLEPQPGTLMRFTATYTTTTWTHHGDISHDAGRSWTPHLALNLTKASNTQADPTTH